MEPAEQAGSAREIARGALTRCPRCGGGDLFTGWFKMRDSCPHCELRFGGDEGYWLGAIMINLAATSVAFVVALVAIAAATWPDVPWGWVLVGGLVVNAAVPILFFQRSRTLWVALERSIRS